MEFGALFWSVVVGAAAWLANEWRRRSIDDFKRKEERYIQLLNALNGFYVGADDRLREKAAELKQNFIDQVKLCWLYCPDDVIRKANAFLTSVENSSSGKELLAGELFLAIRKDLFSIKYVAPFGWRHLTCLRPEDFKHCTVPTRPET